MKFEITRLNCIYIYFTLTVLNDIEGNKYLPVFTALTVIIYFNYRYKVEHLVAKDEPVSSVCMCVSMVRRV